MKKPRYAFCPICARLYPSREEIDSCVKLHEKRLREHCRAERRAKRGKR